MPPQVAISQKPFPYLADDLGWINRDSQAEQSFFEQVLYWYDPDIVQRLKQFDPGSSRYLPKRALEHALYERQEADLAEVKASMLTRVSR